MAPTESVPQKRGREEDAFEQSSRRLKPPAPTRTGLALTQPALASTSLSSLAPSFHRDSQPVKTVPRCSPKTSSPPTESRTPTRHASAPPSQTVSGLMTPSSSNTAVATPSVVSKDASRSRAAPTHLLSTPPPSAKRRDPPPHLRKTPVVTVTPTRLSAVAITSALQSSPSTHDLRSPLRSDALITPSSSSSDTVVASPAPARKSLLSRISDMRLVTDAPSFTKETVTAKTGIFSPSSLSPSLLERLSSSTDAPIRTPPVELTRRGRGGRSGRASTTTKNFSTATVSPTSRKHARKFHQRDEDTGDNTVVHLSDVSSPRLDSCRKRLCKASLLKEEPAEDTAAPYTPPPNAETTVPASPARLGVAHVKSFERSAAPSPQAKSAFASLKTSDFTFRGMIHFSLTPGVQGKENRALVSAFPPIVHAPRRTVRIGAWSSWFPIVPLFTHPSNGVDRRRR